MSLQWTIVATFLYTEIAFIVLLILPIISASRWQKIFRSRLLSIFTHYGNLYFNILIVILLVLFLDAIRDMRKYSILRINASELGTDTARINVDMKMFRSQRNFYIAGFAVFLWLVLRKLVVFISRIATLEADVHATKKQAESASAAARQMMEQCENVANEKVSTTEEKSADTFSIQQLKKELTEAHIQLQKALEDLSKSQLDSDTIKKQAQASEKEYDRLLKEYGDIQEKVKLLEGDKSCKKDD